MSILLTRLAVQACRMLDAEQTCLLVGDSEDDRRFVVAAAHGKGEEAIGRRVMMDRALAGLFSGDGASRGERPGGVLPVLDGRAGVALQARAPSGRAVLLCAAAAGREAPPGTRRARLLTHVASLCAAAVDGVGTTARCGQAARSCAEGLAAAAALEESPPHQGTVNVVALAARVGERLRLDPGALVELRLAACVHALAPGEPTETGERVARIPGLEAVALIIGLLHERWDGLGQPHGLRGDRIPLASRILATCASVDALARHELDGPDAAVDSALRCVQAASGTVFDPTVVTALSYEIIGEVSPVDDPSWVADWARADVPYALA